MTSEFPSSAPSTPHAALDIGLAEEALRSGSRERAETICRKRLEALPDDPATLALLGRAILRREGFVRDALPVLRAAFEVAPDDVEARCMYCEALLRAGDVDAAAEIAEPLSGEPPGDAMAATIRDAVNLLVAPQSVATMGNLESLPATQLLLLGRSLNGQGRFSESVPVILSALKVLDPPLVAFPALMRGLAGVGQIADVLQVCRWVRRDSLDLPRDERVDYIGEIEIIARALNDANADHPETMAILGTALLENNRSFDQGVTFLNAANILKPDLPDYLLGAGIARFRLGEFVPAAAYLYRAVQAVPDWLEASRLLRLAEAAQGSDLAASGILDAAANDLLTLGQSLCVSLRLESAEQVLRAAIAKAPDLADPYITLGAVVSMLDRESDAVELVAEACRLAPESPEARSEMAVTSLSVQSMEGAWDHYESRLQHWRRDTQTREFPMPQWNGEDLNGKTVLVWREEGIGDELRFSSCLPDLIASADSRIVLECSDRLQSIYERRFPDIAVRPEDLSDSALDGFDFHIPLLSLAGVYRQRLADYPPSGAFISADPDRVADWRGRLAHLGDGPKIGIGWRSMSMSWRKRPLHTSLVDWEPLIGRDDVQMVNLQFGDWEAEVSGAEARTGRPVHRFADLDLKNDLENVVALMTALDMVVCARCWVPTFCGAVGTDVACVTRRPNPYMFGLDYDPWAPTTSMIYARHD